MSESEPRRFPGALERLAHGERVFLTVHRDTFRERIDVRTTEVLGLEGDVLFLAQTDPPVPRAMLGVTVEAAWLLDAGSARKPVGYAARLLDIRPDYPGPGGVALQALALSAPGPDDLFETSLRMHHRVPVDEEMGVVILLKGPQVGPPPMEDRTMPGGRDPDQFGVPEGFGQPELLDFSAGGARVRLPGFVEVSVGDVLPFKLLFLGNGYADGDGVVRSAMRSEGGDSLTLGLCFTNMDIRDIRYLERMVARIVSACRQRERDAEYV